MTITALALLLFATGPTAEGIRVVQARQKQQATVRAHFEKAEVPYPPKEVLLRAFKLDDTLEVWAGPGNKAPLKLITTYKICARSGQAGPKRKRGDGQVPEGFYEITRWNPTSNYHLSLGVNYPNASDRILGKTGNASDSVSALGGDIYIHGDCVTIGCIPIEDTFIEQLYILTTDARAAGAKVYAHFFPTHLNAAGFDKLGYLVGKTHPLMTFWRMLAPGYEAFEKTRQIPRVSVNPQTGQYVFDAGREP